jgi:predicted metal-dependent hydrolase
MTLTSSVPTSPSPNLTQLHPRACEGIRLFNLRRYFEAHEALEAAWMAETRPLRSLYQGILQVAVAYYHIQRGNPRGALKLFHRCRANLAPFPDNYLGINLGKLREDYQAIENRIRQAPASGAKLDPGLFPPIQWVDPEQESK